MRAEPVRVLVVDDSALMRKLIPQILQADDSIQVGGTAMDGNFGLKKIEELKPQVITLDLEMPGMGGLDMLKEIMRRHRIPVIVVSSHSTQGASITLKALSLGAFDFVAKPSDVSVRMQEIARDLISKIKAAAHSRGFPITAPADLPMPVPRQKVKTSDRRQQTKIIMTGMGEDGAHGLGLMKAAGGTTIAQSEQSCVVFGMPKAAIERGHAMRVVDLEAIANTLQAQCSQGRNASPDRARSAGQS